jgi:hypothetical protein
MQNALAKNGFSLIKMFFFTFSLDAKSNKKIKKERYAALSFLRLD